MGVLDDERRERFRRPKAMGSAEKAWRAITYHSLRWGMWMAAGGADGTPVRRDDALPSDAAACRAHFEDLPGGVMYHENRLWASPAIASEVMGVNYWVRQPPFALHVDVGDHGSVEWATTTRTISEETVGPRLFEGRFVNNNDEPVTITVNGQEAEVPPGTHTIQMELAEE